jgi:hypothetical protein
MEMGLCILRERLGNKKDQLFALIFPQELLRWRHNAYCRMIMTHYVNTYIKSRCGYSARTGQRVKFKKESDKKKQNFRKSHQQLFLLKMNHAPAPITIVFTKS